MITPSRNGVSQSKSSTISGSAPPITPVSWPRSRPPRPAKTAALVTYGFRSRPAVLPDAVAASLVIEASGADSPRVAAVVYPVPGAGKQYGARGPKTCDTGSHGTRCHGHQMSRRQTSHRVNKHRVEKGQARQHIRPRQVAIPPHEICGRRYQRKASHSCPTPSH
ncbi:hypothetical protein FAIPA1_460029 [Frankia sp. AiPs1]